MFHINQYILVSYQSIHTGFISITTYWFQIVDFYCQTIDLSQDVHTSVTVYMIHFKIRKQGVNYPITHSHAHVVVN